MKLCSRVFPLELECLKTLDTPCSVSFSFFLPFLFLALASCAVEMKSKMGKREDGQHPQTCWERLKYSELCQVHQSCDIIVFWLFASQNFVCAKLCEVP